MRAFKLSFRINHLASFLKIIQHCFNWNAFLRLLWYITFAPSIYKSNKFKVMRIIKLKVYWCTIHIRMLSQNTLSCLVLPLSFWFSIWAKHPQNLLVSLWIVDHRLFKESLVRLNFLSLWKVNQILSRNVKCFWFVDVTASKLTLSHANTSLMSSSIVKWFPRWLSS